jgi:L-fucose mutarotase/ribose pyranase (RbsD/FucU family)
MKTKHFLDLYPDSVEHNHGTYAGLEIHGVRNDGEECWIDDDNPLFFSIYARHADGTCLVCADASVDWLNELRAFARNLASKYSWKYQDFTVDKPYQTRLSPIQAGTRIISIKGEMSTESGECVFIAANAEGVVSQVSIGENGLWYLIAFPKGVSVFRSPGELADSSRYAVLRRVIARFQPQAWVNDTAINIDGARDLDVTDRLLDLPLKDILMLEDDDYPSDELVYGLTDHVGPHYVEVKDSILEFFAVDKLADITEEMLVEKRNLYATESSSSARNETDAKSSTHSLVLVNLSSGDVGLVLDGKIVLTADPDFDSVEQVNEAANNLADILGVEIKTTRINRPEKDDWNWNDVLLNLNVVLMSE